MNLSKMPEAAVSLWDMAHNRTGSWRYLRPVYREGLAPCRGACPAGTDIPRVLLLIGEGRIGEAYQLIKEANPLPGVCGRVCPHPCELSCNRTQLDEPASIQALERFVADTAMGDPLERPAPERRAETVAVVGSGPAGLSCAYFLAWAGFGVTVLEAEYEPGGMLRLGIPKYRLPREVLDREIEEVAHLGVRFEVGTRLGRDVDLEALWREHDAVFVATGAHRSRPLGIPGEDEPAVTSGLAFLKAANAGRPPDVGERVLVIGGGNTAVDAARTALRLGARPTIVYRRSRREMPAIAEEIKEAEEEGVRFVFLAAPLAFRRAKGAIRASFIRMKLGPPDPGGRRRPEPIPDAEFALEADQVLTAIGEEPVLDFACERFETSAGLLLSNPRGLLEREGVFFGGDARTGPSTVVEAIASGKRAAAAIMSSLGASERPAGLDLLAGEVTFGELNPAYFAPASRAPTPRRPAEARISDFREVVGALSPEQAVAEARRCLSCGVCNECDNCRVFCPEAAVHRVNGAYEVELDYCKGCAICVQECPHGAIQLVGEA